MAENPLRMIVDTSALVAMVHKEPGWENLLNAILESVGGIPIPALIEFHRVVARR